MRVLQWLAFLWTLFIIHTRLVHSDIQFLEAYEGESVVLPCVTEQRSSSPFGVYLKRRWLQPGEVLFMYTKEKITVNNKDDKNRISITGDPSSHCLNVTISQLRLRDTDQYYCEFLVDKPSSQDEHILGKTEFFILVKPGNNCGCSNYSVLLYVLSSAVATLLLVLIGLVVCCQAKTRHRVNSQPQAPVYEEMVGVQPRNQKLAPHHLEETQSSQYRNVLVKKSCSENHYESPSGVPCLRTESHK